MRVVSFGIYKQWPVNFFLSTSGGCLFLPIITVQRFCNHDAVHSFVCNELTIVTINKLKPLRQKGEHFQKGKISPGLHVAMED